MLRPIKVVITNYPEDKIEELDAINNPEDPNAGTRKIPFSREIFIERDDFMEVPPPKYFRLKPGGEVRLKYGLHHQVRRSDQGCFRQRQSSFVAPPISTARPAAPTSDRKVKGTIHWVSAAARDRC